MVEELHRVDPETCAGDGICVDVCPEIVLEIRNGKAATVEARAERCILCGQCVAVCPNDALGMPKLPAADFEDLAGPPFRYPEFLHFLKLRRSVRVFKDRPVERDVIEKILAAAATAPMGFPPHSTEVVVIDRREELEFLLEQLVHDYGSLLRAVSSPLGRAMIRLTAGADQYRHLTEHIVDSARSANDAYSRDGTDRYTYRAPALMLFHADHRVISFDENAHLVCHHAMLAAVSRLDGAFGTGALPPEVDPRGGALAGLAKTVGHEWPEVFARALDIDPALSADAAAAALSDELLRASPTEVGVGPEGRITLEAVPSEIAGRGTCPVGPGDVVLVSGGGRGITAEAAVALARASRATSIPAHGLTAHGRRSTVPKPGGMSALALTEDRT